MAREPEWVFAEPDGYGALEVLRALHELKNMRTLIKEENEKLRKEIKSISGELEIAAVDIEESEDSFAKYNNKIEAILEEIELLRAVRNRLLEEINLLRLEAKAALSDSESSSLALETMSQELENIESEKAILLNRLQAVDKGITKISQERECSVPDLKDHDRILRKVYRKFKEAGDRMDVSIRFRGIGSGEKD